MYFYQPKVTGNMLTEDSIIKQLNNNHSKELVNQLADQLRAERFDIRKLIDLTFHHDAKTAFRMAWLLDTTLLGNPELCIEDLPYLIDRMVHVSNQSCKRHYARIMMHLTAPEAPADVRLALQQTDPEPLVELCFEWLIDPKTKVAVQVCAADTLFNLRVRYPWIADELRHQVVFMMRNGTAAMQARGRKLLAGLSKQESQDIRTDTLT